MTIFTSDLVGRHFWFFDQERYCVFTCGWVTGDCDALKMRAMHPCVVCLSITLCINIHLGKKFLNCEKTLKEVYTQEIFTSCSIGGQTMLITSQTVYVNASILLFIVYTKM